MRRGLVKALLAPATGCSILDVKAYFDSIDWGADAQGGPSSCEPTVGAPLHRALAEGSDADGGWQHRAANVGNASGRGHDSPYAKGNLGRRPTGGRLRWAKSVCHRRGEPVGTGIAWRMTIASLETRISFTRSRTMRWRSETSNVFAVARSRARKLVIVSASRRYPARSAS